MYKSKRSLKVYEAPLGLNGKQQIPRIQLQGQWLEALDIMWVIRLMFSLLMIQLSSIK